MQPKRLVTFGESGRGQTWRIQRGCWGGGVLGRGPCPRQVVQLQNRKNRFPLKHESFLKALEDVDTPDLRCCHMPTARSQSDILPPLAAIHRELLLPFGGMCRWTWEDCLRKTADAVNVSSSSLGWCTAPLWSSGQLFSTKAATESINQVILILIALFLFKKNRVKRY